MIREKVGRRGFWGLGSIMACGMHCFWGDPIAWCVPKGLKICKLLK
jgi:hypothetical protein